MPEVRDLEIVYDGVMPVLRGVSLKAPAGSIVALLGANGVGETTLLRALSGLPDVYDGEITSSEFSGSRSAEREADNDRRDRRLSRRPVG
jgi:branched-chain amino acid transport system ATP-binding protein